MVFWLQTASAITGIIAAALWFWSAASKAPPVTYAEIGQLPAFLGRAGRCNQWAAGVTAVSVLLSAVATWLQAKGP